jgi:hypothetical protein
MGNQISADCVNLATQMARGYSVFCLSVGGTQNHVHLTLHNNSKHWKMPPNIWRATKTSLQFYLRIVSQQRYSEAVKSNFGF